MKRVQVHKAPCPSAAQVRRCGRRVLCHCAWEVCNWLHDREVEYAAAEAVPHNMPTEDQSGISDAGGVEDEDISEEDAHAQWWSWADRGRGCDAEAMSSRAPW